MTHQFSIRTPLLITTLVAICVGLFACARSFYAANAEVRAAELRSINSIVGMFGPGEIVVSEPGGSYAFDGSMFPFMTMVLLAFASTVATRING